MLNKISKTLEGVAESEGGGGLGERKRARVGAYKIIRQLCVYMRKLYIGTITIMKAYAPQRIFICIVLYTYITYYTRMRYAREVIFTRIIHLQRLLFQSFARFHAIRVIKCYIGLNRFGENCMCGWFFPRILCGSFCEKHIERSNIKKFRVVIQYNIVQNWP